MKGPACSFCARPVHYSLVPIFGPYWFGCHRHCPGVSSICEKALSLHLLSPLQQEERRESWCGLACKHLPWASYLEPLRLLKDPPANTQSRGLPGSSSLPNSLQNRTNLGFPYSAPHAVGAEGPASATRPNPGLCCRPAIRCHCCSCCGHPDSCPGPSTLAAQRWPPPRMRSVDIF